MSDGHQVKMGGRATQVSEVHPLMSPCAIDYLLDPLDRETFVRDFWGRRPVLIKGWPDKFKGFLDRHQMEGALASTDKAERSNAVLIRASMDRGRNHSTIHSSQVLKVLEDGGTACIEGLEAILPHLAQTAANIRSSVGFIGKTDFRCYWSSRGHGFDMHFDARVATTLQIAGTKRWTFSEEVAVPWPHYQVQAGMQMREIMPWEQYRPVDQCMFRDVILEPGDVLCLPAGTWHSAVAIEESLALNLAFSFTGGLWSLMLPILRDMTATVPAWRQPPPLSCHNDSAGAVSSDLASYLRARMVELGNLCLELESDPEALDEACKRIAR